ncbi:hypothetical protein V5O48_001911, partial [Marasmius crinis-equi]
TVNIQDSSRMQQLTEAAVRDSAAMKQIAYLTMIFLPASYTASAFGMNVKELTGDHTPMGIVIYVAVAIPMTIVTIWVIMTFQSKNFFRGGSDATFWMRLGWPVLYVRAVCGLDKETKKEEANPIDLTILQDRRRAYYIDNQAQV